MALNVSGRMVAGASVEKRNSTLEGDLTLAFKFGEITSICGLVVVVEPGSNSSGMLDSVEVGESLLVSNDCCTSLTSTIMPWPKESLQMQAKNNVEEICVIDFIFMMLI